MKISSISIKNHSRIPDLSLDIRDHLVLVGPNGAGKSSILRCLHMLLGIKNQQLYYNITVDDFRDPKGTFCVEAKLTGLSETELSAFPDEVDAGDGDSLTIRLEAIIESEDDIAISRYCPNNGVSGKKLSASQLEQIGWTSISADSEIRNLRSGRKSIIDELLKKIDISSDEADLRAVMDSLCGVIEGSSVFGATRKDLAGRLSLAIRGGLSDKDLRFIPGAAIGDNLLSDVRLQMNSHRGGMKEVTEQSDGDKALISLAVFYLINARTDIIAIDEPEVHLHPASQRNLIKLLQNRGGQLVMATHSPVIAGMFDPDNIVVIHDEGSTAQPAVGFLDDDQRMLARWWISKQLEPLTARKILAVEGQSDRMIVEAVADSTGRHLERDGIEILETGGCGDMKAVYTLFGPRGFQIPIVMLVDEDAVHQVAELMDVSPSELAEKSVSVSHSDLEDEYISAIGAEALWNALKKSSLFSKAMLDSCSTASSDGIPTETELAQFCRKKNSRDNYKVPSAVVACGLINTNNASKIKSVERALEDAES